MPLTKLSNDQGYLKAGILGYQKSGKSYTATKLAIGVRAYFKLDGPIAMFDTESGSGYLADMVRKETGQELLGVRARSFAALMQFAKDCVQEKVSVALVDSITHPWRELCDSYLVQLNQRRAERRLSKLMKLEFQHWADIKAQWEPWSEFFLNSPLHLIVCGRAGAIWEFEKNEESGRKELVKAGTKMKVEGEFGFEPSLLVEMERDQVPDGQGGFKLIHIATVLGDRFSILDGHTQENPTFEFFKPHIAMLRAGAHAPVDTATKTETGADVEGGEWEKEKRARTILCEEIQGEIVNKYPGQSADDKRAKADLMQSVFGTRSWTRIESMQSYQLREGLQRLREKLGVSTTETEDDLPFDNPPQDAPEPKSGVQTSPAPEKPAVWPAVKSLGAIDSNLQGEPLELLLKVRALLAEVGWDDSRLLLLLTNLGSIEKSVTTLEQAVTVKPSIMKVVVGNFPTYVQAAEEWIKSEQPVKK